MNLSVNPRLKPACDEADALAVLKRLRDAGFVAYFAGGCVRDKLLGRQPVDWDVATDAPPKKVAELFAAAQAVGEAFGVVLVRHRKSVVEVATFRADGAYEDGRRPSSVRFTSAEEDAKRRDFTVNGLFLDPLGNRIIDFVGGQEDLKANRLRAIGNASERFAEDHLRLLRAVRLAARFDFQIEPETAKAMKLVAGRLAGISPERIADELRLMLTPATRTLAWKLLWDFKLGPVIFRFLPKVIAEMDFERSLFSKIAPGETITFGLAIGAGALCVSMQAGPAADARGFLARAAVGRLVKAMRQSLRVSNAEADEMAEALGGLDALLADLEPTLARKKRFLAGEHSGASLKILEALGALKIYPQRVAMLREELARLASEDVAPPPLLVGDDLIAEGLKPGPVFKRILDAAYDAQLEGRVSSRQAAMELAKGLAKQA